MEAAEVIHHPLATVHVIPQASSEPGPDASSTPADDADPEKKKREARRRKYQKPCAAEVDAAIKAGEIDEDGPLVYFWPIAARGLLRILTDPDENKSVGSRMLYGVILATLEAAIVADRVIQHLVEPGHEPRHPNLVRLDAILKQFKEAAPDLEAPEKHFWDHIAESAPYDMAKCKSFTEAQWGEIFGAARSYVVTAQTVRPKDDAQKDLPLVVPQ